MGYYIAIVVVAIVILWLIVKVIKGFNPNFKFFNYSRKRHDVNGRRHEFNRTGNRNDRRHSDKHHNDKHHNDHNHRPKLK